MYTLSLLQGSKVVIPEMTAAEAMVELCQIHQAKTKLYAVVAFKGDDVVGTVDLDDGDLLLSRADGQVETLQ